MENYNDEPEITDCPNCGRTYDDADEDFLICHYCGYDAEEKTHGKPQINMKIVGIDPDETDAFFLGSW